MCNLVQFFVLWHRMDKHTPPVLQSGHAADNPLQEINGEQ